MVRFRRDGLLGDSSGVSGDFLRRPEDDGWERDASAGDGSSDCKTVEVSGKAAGEIMSTSHFRVSEERQNFTSCNSPKKHCSRHPRFQSHQLPTQLQLWPGRCSRSLRRVWG